MLQKIKNFFIKLFCFFFISAIWAISMASYAEGGAEINGILAFLLWLVNLTYCATSNRLCENL